MKREYSFNEISRITMGPQPEIKNINPPYYATNKSRDTWTDLRVEEIKKKYDTPSHRKNYSYYQNNDKAKDSHAELQTNNSYISYRNPLADSSSSPNQYKLESRSSFANGINTSSNYYKNTEPRNSWDEKQYIPRFSYDTKQNSSSFMDKFSQMKTQLKYQSKVTPSKEQFKPRDMPSGNKVDPRVQNIDKINMKIKKILDCLNENQKHPRILEEKTETKNSFMKGSVMSKDNQSEQFEETKIISRQKFGYEREISKNNLKNSVTSHDKYNNTPQYKRQEPYNYSYKWNGQEKQSYNKSSIIPVVNPNASSESFFKDESKGKKNIDKNEDNSDSWFEPSKKLEIKNRSRSCLGNPPPEDIKLNSGKKLDDEISKINVRIKQFEEEKKKLNIDFKPYNCQLKYNRSSSNLTVQNKTHRGNKPPIPKPATRTSEQTTNFNNLPQRNLVIEKVKTEANEYVNRSTYDYKRESYQNPQRYTFDHQKYNKDREESRELTRKSSASHLNYLDNSQKGQQKAEKSSRTPQFQQKYVSDPKSDKPKQFEPNNHYSNELKEKTELGIEERKRKLLDTATVTFSRQTKRLIQNFFEQVKLDEELRNVKIWFRDCLDGSKWEQLQQQCKRKLVSFERSKFELSEQQDNPFYSVRQSEENCKNLVEKWMNSEKYWRENISHQFNLKEFQVEKFTNDKVDLEKKGYFVVEDLVRFLNMETGTFYRNRDLILVFRRLTHSDKIRWEEFLAQLDETKQ